MLMGQMGPPRPFLEPQRIVVDDLNLQMHGETPRGSRGSLGRNTAMGEVAPQAQGGIPASDAIPALTGIEGAGAIPASAPLTSAPGTVLRLRAEDLPLGDPDARMQQLRARAGLEREGGKSPALLSVEPPSAPIRLGATDEPFGDPKGHPTAAHE